MSVDVLAWASFAAFLVVLGARTTLTEAVWPQYRVEVRPRRVVRVLDVLAAVLALALVTALASVIGPPLLAR